MPSRYTDEAHHPSLNTSTILPSIDNHDHIEAVHKDGLLHARREHERVREAALRAYRNWKIEEEQERLRVTQEQEYRRLELEQQRAHLAANVAALQNQKIEAQAAQTLQISQKRTSPEAVKLLPAATSDVTSSILKATKQEAVLKAELKRENAGPVKSVPPADHSLPIVTPQSLSPALMPFSQNKSSQQQINQPVPPSQHSQAASNTNIPSTSRVSQATSITDTRKPSIAVPVSTAIDTSHLLPGAHKLLEIHRSLKELRFYMTEQAKQNVQLKKRMGEGRREIRKSVGQLTEGKPGTNRQPLNTILKLLEGALKDKVGPQVDPGMVMLTKPNKLDDPHALNNGDTLPALFIYLLNQFAKCVIRQLLDEAGVKANAANPIGVVVANVFAKAEHLWRGASLIDILMAKYRVVCPVLFGVRGHEETDEGRAKVGWWKENGHLVPEQVHIFRMTGLASGFAAIALRDFSKSKMKNPYPPINYWMSMAAIVNTPLAEASSTQYIVLRSMVNRYEQRFLDAYGHAAKAALQVALVDFPYQQKGKNVQAKTLLVLGDKLSRDSGLQLTFPPDW